MNLAVEGFVLKNNPVGPYPLLGLVLRQRLDRTRCPLPSRSPLTGEGK